MTRTMVVLFLLTAAIPAAVCAMRTWPSNSSVTSTYQQPPTTLWAVVIPIEFPDLEHRFPIKDAQHRFWTVDIFYRRESYGRVQINVTFGGHWFRTNVPLGELDIQRWNFNRTDMNRFRQESTQAADHEIDFRDYDVVFILATGLVHPNAAYIDVSTNDGVSSLKVAVVNEWNNEGMYAHELGHLLASSDNANGFRGLPDLYSYELAAKNQTSDVWVGSWDLMSNSTGLAGLSAWSKITLGWITPEVIAIEESSVVPVRLNSLESHFDPRAVVVPINQTTSYVIEVRQRITNPTDNVILPPELPTEGVLIYLTDLTKQSGYGILRIVDSNPTTETLDDAPLRRGNVFEDDENRIYVLVGLASGDGFTIIISGMNNPDFDGDTLSNHREVNEYGTDPLKADTDDDCWRDDKDPSPTSSMIPNSIIAVAAVAVLIILLLSRRFFHKRFVYPPVAEEG